MNIRLLLSIPVLLALGACTWVPPTTQGRAVMLVKGTHVEHCQRLGATTTSVKYRIGPITRPESKVTEELVTLAKNEAADAGGDSIVARGPMQEGSMTFDIYKCAK